MKTLVVGIFIEDVNIKREKFGLSGYERCCRFGNVRVRTVGITPGCQIQNLRLRSSEARVEAWKNNQLAVELQGGRVPILRGTFVVFFRGHNIAGRDRLVRMEHF